MSDGATPLPGLTHEEVRVLGSLIEKSQATPEYYPMTLNALVAACNQKSSRDPVVEYDEDTVVLAIDGLKEKGLCAEISGTGRVEKFAHRIGSTGLGLTPAQAAICSILLLRGAQTTAEIKTRTARQFSFSDLDFTQQVVDSLVTRDPAIVEEAPRRAGQKEKRYRHLFHPWPEEEGAPETEPLRSVSGDLRVRVEALEAALAQLREDVERMRGDLYGQ